MSYIDLQNNSIEQLLALILLELRAMRKQESDYWETWRISKQAEQPLPQPEKKPPTRRLE